MRSCWDADPFNRPPFRKVVEQIEQQLSDTAKHVGLALGCHYTFKHLVTVVLFIYVLVMINYDRLGD